MGRKYVVNSNNKLTSAGIVRLNDSIRAYAYCILGAQADARSAIIGSFGTELRCTKIILKITRRLNKSTCRYSNFYR
jgi:hypothetical protein